MSETSMSSGEGEDVGEEGDEGLEVSRTRAGGLEREVSMGETWTGDSERRSGAYVSVGLFAESWLSGNALGIDVCAGLVTCSLPDSTVSTGVSESSSSTLSFALLTFSGFDSELLLERSIFDRGPPLDFGSCRDSCEAEALRETEGEWERVCNG